MRIVGCEQMEGDAPNVHTIDIWYSKRRRLWIVERLDADGNQMGTAFHCASEDDVGACLEEWLRAHDSTHLCAPRELTAAERRILLHHRQAA